MKHFFVVFMIALSFNAFTQEDKIVTLVVNGSGKTQDEAKQNALRSAIEQAFGVFISSKTEILNDQIVADQMSSISSGNIRSFEMLNEAQLTDERYGVTLKAQVSVSKLMSFVESKGIAIEIKGGVFALNIKQQLLNEQGEVKAVAELIDMLHEPLKKCFDYKIESGDPKSLDSESKNWEMVLAVTSICNKNIDFCANYFMKTLEAISLSNTEVETYKSLNKPLFSLKIEYSGKKNVYYLRKEISVSAIDTLALRLFNYASYFVVENGFDEIIANDFESQIFNFKGVRFNEIAISFPSIGQCAGWFTYKDKKTLEQIEQMNGYKVKPRDGEVE